MKSKFFNLQHVLLLACAAVTIMSCTKADYKDDVTPGDPPPVPGGYTNSSQVAATNLLAYWDFENTRNESKSGTAPSTQLNTSFITGIKGQGLKFDAGYVLYPTITALSSANAVGSVTVSMWVNFKNNGSQASEFFALTRTPATQTDWLTILNVAAETGRPTTTDNLTFHSWIGSYPSGSRVGGDNINDFGAVGVDYQLVPGANKWVHYVMRYDGPTSTIDLYANSIRVSNNNFRVRTGLGSLVSPTPTQVLLGGFPNSSTGYPLSGTQTWQALLTGSMDELRVYNKALTDVEISALFKLERQGR